MESSGVLMAHAFCRVSVVMVLLIVLELRMNTTVVSYTGNATLQAISDFMAHALLP